MPTACGADSRTRPACLGEAVLCIIERLVWVLLSDLLDFCFEVDDATLESVGLTTLTEGLCLPTTGFIKEPCSCI